MTGKQTLIVNDPFQSDSISQNFSDRDLTVLESGRRARSQDRSEKRLLRTPERRASSAKAISWLTGVFGRQATAETTEKHQKQVSVCGKLILRHQHCLQHLI